MRPLPLASLFSGAKKKAPGRESLRMKFQEKSYKTLEHDACHPPIIGTRISNVIEKKRFQHIRHSQLAF